MLHILILIRVGTVKIFPRENFNFRRDLSFQIVLHKGEGSMLIEACPITLKRLDSSKFQIGLSAVGDIDQGIERMAVDSDSLKEIIMR